MKGKHTYQHTDVSGKLPDTLRVNPYTVPDGYFEDLHQLILLQCNRTYDASTPFGVPAGYFEQLEGDITARIAEQQLQTMVTEPGFSVPDGYFDNLEADIRAYAAISKKGVEPGFTVPVGYFEDLQGRISARTSRTIATPVRKINTPRWIAYAAASIAIIMGVFGILRLVDDSEPSSPLASVSDQEILNYLELYGNASDMIYISENLDEFDATSIGAGLNEADIEAYLNHTL